MSFYSHIVTLSQRVHRAGSQLKMAVAPCVRTKLFARRHMIIICTRISSSTRCCDRLWSYGHPEVRYLLSMSLTVKNGAYSLYSFRVIVLMIPISLPHFRKVFLMLCSRRKSSRPPRRLTKSFMNKKDATKRKC